LDLIAKRSSWGELRLWLPGVEVSKAERTRRLLIVSTAVSTFTAGELAAHGHMTLFVVMLVLLALVWLVAAIAHA
jgi:hypothetical protein